MDFTEPIPSTAPAVFSPNRQYFATAQDYRLTIRHCDSLAVAQVFSCLGRIEEVAWSPDSDHILCGVYKRATVQVFSVSDSTWTCTIAEGPAGIVAARWAPSGQHILLTSDFQVRLSVWSLVDQKCKYLRGPKHDKAGCAFSPDGTLLAVAGRIDCKDVVTTYDCSTWELVRQWVVATSDLADLAWSPDGSCLAVWDAPAMGYTVAVYTPTGECLVTKTVETDPMGLKCVSWSPSGQLLAVGTYDQDVKVLNHVTWNALTHFQHPVTITGPAALVAYSEVEEDTGRRASQQENDDPQQLERELSSTMSKRRPAVGGGRAGSFTGGRPGSFTGGRPGSFTRPGARPTKAAEAEDDEEGAGGEDGAVTRSRYVVAELPVKLNTLRVPLDKPNPKLGVGTASWSFDGSYMMTRCDSMPSVVWIWDVARLELAAMMQQAAPIKSALWDPSSNRLAVATGSTKVYLWTPEGASCVHIPLPSFRAFNMRWHPDGASIILADRTAICCAYLTPSETPNSTVETPISELLERATSKEESTMVDAAAATAVAVN